MPERTRKRRRRGALSIPSRPLTSSSMFFESDSDPAPSPLESTDLTRVKPRRKRQPTKKTADPTKRKRGVLETVADASGTILDNVLPNVGDEVAGFGAGLGYVLTGRDYMDGFEKGQSDFEHSQKLFAEESPVIHGASAATGFVGGLALPAGRVLQAPTRAQKARQGATWGMGYGALSGAFDGDGLEERAANAAISAPIGGALGYVAPGLVDDAIASAPEAANFLRELAADASGELKGTWITGAEAASQPKKLRVTHSSPNRELTEVDPSLIGSNRKGGSRFTHPQEVSKAQTATGGRSYFGVRTGQEGGYREEQSAAQQYEAYVDPARYLATDGDSADAPIEYDSFLAQADEIRSDPKALEELGLPSAAPRSVVTERLIKNAGFDGIHYGPAWNQKYGSNMGEVLHHWGDPVPVEPVRRALDPEAFRQADLDPVMQRDDWAIMTAENPMGKAISPEDNAARNQKLLEEARAIGIDPVPVTGHYGGNPESSYMLSPITQEQAVRLGHQFEQDSVLTNRGLLYGDGTITPAEGAQFFDEAPEDFFSVIETPQGPANFAVNLKWGDDGEMVRVPDPELSGPDAPAIIQRRLPRDPDYGYPVKSSNLKNQPSYDEIGVEFDPTRELAPRRIVNPEELQGGTLIAGMADLTRAGGVLRGVNGSPFRNPVNMQGGQDFMREQAAADTGMLWASDKSPMSAVMNAAKEIEGPAYYAPFTMNAGASDYSHHMSQAIQESLVEAPSAARADFDELMRKRFPEFVGTSAIETEKGRKALSEQLSSAPGIRTAMAKNLDKARWRDAGMPNIGVLRQAVNDPALSRAPTESFGYSLGRIDPERSPVAGGELPHETYSTQIPGEYVGGLESHIPANIMLPDFFEDAMGKPNARREDIAYRLKRGVKTQKMDQEWLDQIMPYLEWARSRGDLDW